MTPQEALELLNQVAATFQTDRQTHVKLQAAVSTLQQVIGPKGSDEPGTED